MAETRIPDQTAGAYSSVSDKTKFSLPVADRTSVDGSGHGTGLYFTFEQLAAALQYVLITKSAHGLTSGDVGKPLNLNEIYDDTDSTHFPTGVLVQSVSSSVLRVAPPGSSVTLSVDMLDDGASYDIDASGRFVYWDASAAIYQATIPVDSAITAPVVLEILSVGASTFTAIVRC